MNDLSKFLNIQYPIVQAPMAGGITTPELVSESSNCGCLGSIGAGYLSPEQTEKIILAVKDKTNKPFQVNLFIPEKVTLEDKSYDQVKTKIAVLAQELNLDLNTDIEIKDQQEVYRKQIEMIIKNQVPIISFTFGLPSKEELDLLKENSIKIIGSACTLEEALAAQEIGCDAVVVQGYEAGGHRASFIGDTESNLIGGFALIPQVVDNLDIPVIYAGGIMDSRGVKAAQILGASAVQIGTAFLLCKESGASETYRQKLLSSKSEDTIFTKSFSGKLARGVKNKFIRELKDLEAQDELLPYPLQNSLTKELRAKAAKDKKADYLSLWAGQACGLNRDQFSNLSAKDLIQSLLKR